MKFKMLLSLFLLLFVLVVAPTISAQEMIKKEATPASTYLLPYAGLLPDNPLYFFKAVRDRIIDFLIADSLKKADFTLLQGDKRLSMSMALVEKGKPELAESTESKGQNYLVRTISLREQAKKEGKDVGALSTKLTASLEKHEEVLLDLASKTSGSVRDSFIAMAAEVDKKRRDLRR